MAVSLFGQILLAAKLENPRLIIFKLDGVPRIFLEAALEPDGPEVSRIPRPDLFRSAYSELRTALEREVLLPNLEYYFKRRGSRVDAVYSGTLPLSAPSWAMIDTGQPSIVKTNYYFDRTNQEIYSYLDQFRESLTMLAAGAGKTTPLWQFDLLGIPILGDAFPQENSWTSMQLLYRKRPTHQVSQLGKFVITAGTPEGSGTMRMLSNQLTQFVYSPDFPERNDIVTAQIGSALVLAEDEAGNETYSFLDLLFPNLDHEFHVDASYTNILGWMVKVDEWFGQVMTSVEKSRRRNQTLVVMLSDHGADFHPTLPNYAFPITRWLRTADFGGHTTLVPHTEDNIHSITLLIRAIDSPNIYESEYSPYGPQVPFGDKDYYTAFLAHAGNPRFDAYFRNNELNALHLMLLDARRFRGDPERLKLLYTAFSSRLEACRVWLQADLEHLRLSARALTGYKSELSGIEDMYSKDSVARLDRELVGDRTTAEVLQNLLSLPTEEGDWLKWARSDFEISRFIPKGYLGPPNTLEQLQDYIIGWATPDSERWRSKIPEFKRLDYSRKFIEFTAANPSAFGFSHPFDFFSVALPVERMVVPFSKPLAQVIWLNFSNSRGQAMILEATDGSIAYLPIRRLTREGGFYSFELENSTDPLGYRAVLSKDLWFSPRRWAEVTGSLYYSVAPVILTDLFRDNFERALQSERFQELTPAGVGKQDHLEWLRFRFRQGKPDFRVWTSRGWNVNTQSHNPGGNHGGFRPLETQLVFCAWAGDDIPLRRGQTIRGPYFSYDIAPTILNVLGLDGAASTAPTYGTPIPLLEAEGPEVPELSNEVRGTTYLFCPTRLE